MRGLFLLILMTGVVANLALVVPVRGDEVVGAVWEIDFKNDKSSIRLRCTKNGKVFGVAGKEVGTWKSKGPQSVIDVTEGGGKRNGTYTITKMNKNPPTYRGSYKSNEGENILISVTLVKD